MNRNKHYGRFVFFGFVVLSILFLIFPIGPFVRTTRAFLAYVFLPPIEIGHFIESYAGSIPEKTLFILNTESENRHLRKLAKENKILQTQLDTLITENRHISKILDLNDVSKWRGIWARVMARDEVNWHGVILVNKGTFDGIKIANAVLASGNGGMALAGRVIFTDKNSCKILLLTDVTSSVRSYAGRDMSEALLEGEGRETLKLSYLPLSAAVKKGDSVFTSLSSSIFPANIKIGEISEIYSTNKYSTYISAGVSPAVKISAIKEVFIITGSRK